MQVRPIKLLRLKALLGGVRRIHLRRVSLETNIDFKLQTSISSFFHSSIVEAKISSQKSYASL